MSNPRFHVLLIATCLVLASGCDSGGSDSEGDPDTLPTVSMFTTGDPDVPFMAIDKSGNVLATSDTDSDGIRHVALRSAGDDGKSLYVQINDDGVPFKAVFGEVTFVFENVRGDSTDVAFVFSDGRIETARDVAHGISLRSALMAKTADEVGRALGAAGIGTGMVACSMEAAVRVIQNRVGGLPPAIVAQLEGLLSNGGFAATCAAAVVTLLVQEANGQDVDPGLLTSVGVEGLNGLSNVLSAFGCQAGAVSACVTALVGVVGQVYSSGAALIDLREAQLRLARGALLTGEGNLKITLTWNNSADLDLYVKEPCDDVEISYQHRESTSGGWLDVDNQGETGRPENIFWPDSGVPPPNGRYKVYVHHYSGPLPLKYDVLIRKNDNDPVSQFGGIMSRENQRNSVASFRYDRGVDCPTTGSRRKMVSPTTKQKTPVSDNHDQ